MKDAMQTTASVAHDTEYSPDPPLLNRELSWLEFNARVLDEALQPQLPTLERLKFLSIFSTNLDEFYMIRVSGVQEQMELDTGVVSPDGLSPAAQLRLISDRLRPLLATHTRCLVDDVLPELDRHGVRIVPYTQLDENRRRELAAFFHTRIFPVLTPLAVDPSHPFPFISNTSLNLGTFVVRETRADEDPPHFARIKLPPTVPRLIPLGGDGHEFVLLEEIMAAHIGTLFPGMRV